MDQEALEKALDAINDAAGLVIDLDWWWPGYESDPVVACEHIKVADTYMLIQTTQSGLMLLNGEVVEPAAKVAQ